ncbi:hypothetical protein E0500_040270 [Streptomyces sp. KM273126]|uniref:hypothetical protein n=1 Tax=Streptomyces sp. KM273126 TaxID=2545247 RepID=UPI00103B9271|nr:hypothetical protein [Streptomyces sp. KM273126]MBA2813391.1 hypothetical protein [Streptomyces sp. KM273126]
MIATERAAPTGVPPCRALRHVPRFLAGLGPLAPCAALAARRAGGGQAAERMLAGVADVGGVELPED